MISRITILSICFLQHDMYKNEGYRVFVVWEHEYRESTRATCPLHIQDVVTEV